MRSLRLLLMSAALAAPLLPCTARAAGASNDYESDDGAWHYRVAPYLWGTGMSGDIGLGDAGPVGSIDASFSDILANLDIAGMAFVDARRDRWGIAADFFYAKLSNDTNAFVDQGYGKVEGETKNKIVHLGATYRVTRTGTSHLDLIGGIRYTDANTTIKVGAGPSLPGGARATDSQNWVDGFVGLRGAAQVSERWGLFGQLDAGAGGTDLSWQAVAGARWFLQSGNSVDVGYRYLSQDYASNDFTYDLRMGGPFLGMSFRF
ncbi:hypothetical protein [Marilutibacter aestuarii]|uniref:Porin family protein n=1 Tax=Marilutibacter aestuarii TaxID=1706195 RepID=A0A508AMF2_9GAMM|nr:hypothetical protein [Lysobacter aestuarii]TQD51300.1 hypothetical protein FKV25_01520 [Lysobacter aestuarii]